MFLFLLFCKYTGNMFFSSLSLFKAGWIWMVFLWLMLLGCLKDVQRHLVMDPLPSVWAVYLHLTLSSSASSSLIPAALMSSPPTSINLLFAVPLDPLPCSSNLSILPIYSLSLFWTCPTHLSLASLCFETDAVLFFLPGNDYCSFFSLYQHSLLPPKKEKRKSVFSISIQFHLNLTQKLDIFTSQSKKTVGHNIPAQRRIKHLRFSCLCSSNLSILLAARIFMLSDNSGQKINKVCLPLFSVCIAPSMFPGPGV